MNRHVRVRQPFGLTQYPEIRRWRQRFVMKLDPARTTAAIAKVSQKMMKKHPDAGRIALRSATSRSSRLLARGGGAVTLTAANSPWTQTVQDVFMERNTWRSIG